MKKGPNVSYDKSRGYENAHRFLAQKSQTQFPKRQNERKLLFYNELRLSGEAPAKTETKPNEAKNKPNFIRRSLGDLSSEAPYGEGWKADSKAKKWGITSLLTTAAAAVRLIY